MNRPGVALPDPAALDALPVEELPAIIAHLAALQTAAAMRLRRPTAPAAHRLLTAAEAADVLNVPVEWVEKKSRTFDFRVKLADGTIRYDSAKLRQWLERRTGAVR